MAALDFQPYRYSIEELLQRRYYSIPRFQRPYSWDTENLEEFWRDVVEDNPEGYFLGPMVGWTSGEQSTLAHVVDGQQRITTIVVLLSILRERYRALGEDQLAQGVQNLLERADRNNELKFVLQTEDPTPYLNRRVLTYPADETVQATTANERNLRAARKWLDDKVGSLMPSNGSPTSRRGALRALSNVRDRVLALRIIWVNLGNEDDAYVVFETLNSRGKDLAVADLLKNHLLNRIRVRNKRADAARDEWDEMRKYLDEASPAVDTDRFIQHWWLSQEDYVAQKKLFKAIRKKIRTKDQAIERLNSISKDAPLYRAIVEPSSTTWGPEEYDIRDALLALGLFGVVQPSPLLLAMLRARRDKSVKLKQLRPTFQAIERFHYQTTAVSARSSSGGISGMYARFARELSRAGDESRRAKVLQECRALLGKSLPDEDVVLAAFPERLIFTNQLAREKKLVQYTLRGLHEATRDHRPSRPTIEHILPQEEIARGIPARVVGQIGNLLWVSEELNTELDNKSFAAKKAILAKYKGQYDIDDILAAKSWGQAEIAARSERLAKAALAGPWSLTAL